MATAHRDHVWAVLIEQRGEFTTADVRAAIGDEPIDDAIIDRVLASATDLGVIHHEEGSPVYYRTRTE